MIKKKHQNRQNLIKVDFHSHILPKIDDGAKNLETSVELLTAAKSAGFEKIIATPHFYPHRHYVDTFLEKRNTAFSSIEKSDKFPEIICGAEVLVCEGLEEMANLDLLCIENTNTMLVELPFDDTIITGRMYETVECLISEKKFNIVMAHPSRYNKAIVDNMIDIGAKLQINIEHLCRFSERTRILKWLSAGLVCAVGSDAHRNSKIYVELKKVEKYINSYIDAINEKTAELLNI